MNMWMYTPLVVGIIHYPCMTIVRTPTPPCRMEETGPGAKRGKTGLTKITIRSRQEQIYANCINDFAIHPAPHSHVIGLRRVYVRKCLSVGGSTTHVQKKNRFIQLRSYTVNNADSHISGNNFILVHIPWCKYRLKYRSLFFKLRSQFCY